MIQTEKIKSTVVLTDHSDDKYFLILSEEQIRVLEFLIDELCYNLSYDIIDNVREL